MSATPDRRSTAIQMYNSATAAVKADPRAAYRLLSSCVMVDPSFGQGWFMLGNSNADLQLWHGAVAAYRRAVALPDGEATGDMEPSTRQKAYANLAHRLYHLGQIADAWEANAQALLLDPDEAFSHVNASMLESLDGSHARAIMHAEKALDLSPSAIVGTAAGPLEIPGRVVDELRSRGDERGRVQTGTAHRQLLEPGTSVRMRSGALAGLLGVVRLDEGPVVRVWVQSLFRGGAGVIVAPSELEVQSPSGRLVPFASPATAPA
jgi:tetratricopeptide (TPR) repeat protein